MLSKVSYFRLLYGSEWIHDPAEVRAVNHANFTLSKGGESTEVGRRLASLRILTTDNTRNVRFSGTKFVQFGPDYFIFSASGADFETARAGMEKAPLEERYDACIEIVDLQKLIEVVIKTGIIQTLNDAPVREIWDGCTIADVNYDENEADIQVEDPVSPSPFRKHPKYKDQHEVRCVFNARDDLPERLRIKFAPPQGLIKDVGWRGPIIPATHPSPEQLLSRGSVALKNLNQALQHDERLREALNDKDFNAYVEMSTQMWATYERDYDPELRSVCREIRRHGARSEFIDFMCQRPFTPAFQWQIPDHLFELLKTLAQQHGGEL